MNGLNVMNAVNGISEVNGISGVQGDKWGARGVRTGQPGLEQINS